MNEDVMDCLERIQWADSSMIYPSMDFMWLELQCLDRYPDASVMESAIWSYTWFSMDTERNGSWLYTTVKESRIGTASWVRLASVDPLPHHEKILSFSPRYMFRDCMRAVYRLRGNERGDYEEAGCDS